MNRAFTVAISAAAGLGSVAFLVAMLTIFFRCRRRSNRLTTLPSCARIRNALSVPANSDTASSASYDPSLEISMAELLRATSNFADDAVIGDGGFGLVYKACLSSGVTVAAKKLSKDALQGLREFRAEMDMLGRLKHSNIVKILGFCAWDSERILVYEFMENGSLDQWLYQDEGINGTLSWDKRIKIARGVAHGLRYLHGLETPIIHRDIKASNVLLDEGFNAHIADFGLARTIDARHTHVSTQVAGTMGYMPPEYKDGLTAATTWADVYSFGVLMMEIITARRPNWPVSHDGVESDMVQWVQRTAEANRLFEIVDFDLRDEIVARNAGIYEFFKIACMCTCEKARERPTMIEVVQLLDRI